MTEVHLVEKIKWIFYDMDWINFKVIDIIAEVK